FGPGFLRTWRLLWPAWFERVQTQYDAVFAISQVIFERAQKRVRDNERVISIRPAVPSDAQKIGDVFNAAVREGWMYLGALAQEPMFPPDEWDQLIAEHAPPNVLLVAVDELDEVVGFT